MDGTPIYFRGNTIVKAVFQSLLKNELKGATDVILTGCSGIISIIMMIIYFLLAGGLATYIYADYVKSILPPSIKYRAIADAG